jgi:methionyl-tRNA formyltransferase
LIKILALTGSQIAVQSVKLIIDGNCQFSEQNSEFATYAAKLDKAEAQISWNLDCFRIHNTVRAFAASSGAFITIRGKRLKAWRTAPVNAAGAPGTVLSPADGDPVVACAAGAIRLMEVQSEGKRKVSGAEWFRGARLEEGDVLTPD